MLGTGWHAGGNVMVVEIVAKASLKTIAVEEIGCLLRIIRFNAFSEVANCAARLIVHSLLFP